MNIRKAKVQDASEIAALMCLAMKEIVYQFIGEQSTQKAIIFLEQLVKKKGNQYSYENCWVAETNGSIVGVINLYNGAKLEELRLPVIQFLKSEYDNEYQLEDETKPGEIYIDTIGVRLDQQGKGIGSKILNFIIKEYPNQTLGLLVDKDNPSAKRLYLKLGFKSKEKITLGGKEMERLQYSH